MSIFTWKSIEIKFSKFSSKLFLSPEIQQLREYTPCIYECLVYTELYFYFSFSYQIKVRGGCERGGIKEEEEKETERRSFTIERKKGRKEEEGGGSSRNDCGGSR